MSAAAHWSPKPRGFVQIEQGMPYIYTKASINIILLIPTNMRDLLNLIDNFLTEATKSTNVVEITPNKIEQELKKLGYDNVAIKGKILRVIVQIPEGKKQTEFRKLVQQEIFNQMSSIFRNEAITISNDVRYGSIGAVVFEKLGIAILVKDLGKQGDNSAGVANEIELASLLTSVIQKYGSVNVTFIDERGKKMGITAATNVTVAGRDTEDRKKADVVLYNKTKNLPISIKKLNAEAWESADSLFGERAREIILDLKKKGVIKLVKIAERESKQGMVPVYKLSKEIVVEPTPEESMKAIFGNDLNPEGGIVIQTFKPEHYIQKDNNVTVQCHAVITAWEDIPESHLMVWLLRNDSSRNSVALGIPGIKPMGVTLTRGIGRTGTKDVVLVDRNGNVIKK